MRPTTLSSYRKRKAIKQYKYVFGKKPTNIEFIKLHSPEEPVFRVTDEVDEIYVVFYENILTTYAESLDYFFTEEEIQCMNNGTL